jgi:Zn-dependent protease
MDIEYISKGLTVLSYAFVPALFGIICHETAHGWAAYAQGDPTARHMGRLTLNPIRHIDPVGSAVFALTALTSPVVIGWAKPVPVNPRYFRNPRQGMMLVSVAGPLANLLVALLCALILRIAKGATGPAAAFIAQGAYYGLFINCTLAWFNLLPVPPLDGSHILAGFLPEDLARRYEGIGRYGMMIIILLLASGLFSKVLWPLVDNTVVVIAAIAGL